MSLRVMKVLYLVYITANVKLFHCKKVIFLRSVICVVDDGDL